MSIILRYAPLFLLSLAFGTAQAQNTSSVFSPDVTKGKSAIEYRSAFDPDNDAFVHRLHYQYAFTDSWRLRIIGLQDGDDSDAFAYRYTRLEAMWQFLEDEDFGWDSALRFELQIAEDDSPPSRFRVAWSGKVDLDDHWQLRGNFLTGHEFGEESDDGYLLESRAQISRKITDKWRLAVDYYGDMNDTENFGSFDEQEHQLGPLLKFKTGGRLSGQFGALFGISEAAADTELRLHLTYSF
ncbi:MAG: transporter [Verrucomicrobiota bacterium]